MSAWLWNEREQQGRGEPSGSGVEGIRGGQESPAGEGGLPIANRLHQRQAWLKAQIASWQGLSDDRWRELCKQQEWIRQLQQGKAWLEEQRDIWERLAREHEGKIDELRAWMGELEQGKAWLEEQQASWRRLAEEREGVIRELRAWVGELEQGKAWLEEQRTSWQRVAEERGRLLQAEQEKRRGIWSRLVSVTRPFRDGGVSPDTEPRK
jgi:exonuclease VII small subunit